MLFAGALKKAAENARQDGKSVGCSIVETFGKNAAPQELSDVLRLEYRSKLLNPKWAQVSQDSPLLGHCLLSCGCCCNVDVKACSMSQEQCM